MIFRRRGTSKGRPLEGLENTGSDGLGLEPRSLPVSALNSPACAVPSLRCSPSWLGLSVLLPAVSFLNCEQLLKSFAAWRQSPWSGESDSTGSDRSRAGRNAAGWSTWPGGPFPAEGFPLKRINMTLCVCRLLPTSLLRPLAVFNMPLSLRGI